LRVEVQVGADFTTQRPWQGVKEGSGVLHPEKGHLAEGVFGARRESGSLLYIH
jgi:hypothetical protein